jgi:hypothetical protein
MFSAHNRQVVDESLCKSSLQLRRRGHLKEGGKGYVMGIESLQKLFVLLLSDVKGREQNTPDLSGAQPYRTFPT